MELIQKLTNPMLLIALAGAVTASTANAQFVQDEDHPVIEIREHLDSSGEHTSKWVQRVEDGEHIYTLIVTDGKYEAEVDGVSIPKSQIHRKGSVVVLVDGHGEKIHEFKVQNNFSTAYPQKTVRFGDHGDDQAFAWVSSTGDQDGNVEMRVNIEQPKVMLGINMSEPSEALRKHLRLGEDRQVIMVEKVIDGLPAADAGMESYDIIVSIDGSDEASGEILHKALMNHEAGDKLKLVVLRAGEKIKIAPELAAYDAEKLGVVTYSATVETAEAPRDTWFSDDGKNRIRVERLAAEEADRAKLHEEMMKSAKEALAKAERQVLELRGNQLFVHKQKAEELHDQLLDQWRSLENNREFFAEGKMQLEDRLAELEDRFSSLEDRMDKVAGLIERMFEKMAEDDED